MRFFRSRSLFSSFILSGTAFFALCASLSCGSGSEIVSRLEERIGDRADSGRPEPSPDEIEQALARQLRAAPVPAKGSDKPSSPTFPTRQTLREFYASRGQRLAWCDESGVTLPSVRTFLEALGRAEEHGLDPEDYGLSRLERMGQSMQGAHDSEVSVAHWADFDLLMTTAFFRYASDLSTGRVHPDEIRSEWHTEPPEPDLPGSLDKALQEGALEKLLERLPPPHPGYARLREGLKELRSVEDAGGWPVVPEGPDLKQGARGPRVALLKQRLLAGANPTLQPPGAGALASAVFDAALDEKVRRFQTLHGIEPDGVVSQSTLAELNVPVERRIRQVELNLERWRWIPRSLGEPHIEVNIPGFELQLVRDGRAELRSRIVVGQAFTPTPVFGDQIVAVVANPPWNVPETLAVREYLPELKEDPQAFQRHGIRIYEHSGEDAREVDPASIPWDRVDEEQFKYHLRQDPGPDNALGRMKFHLTNDFQIYLHDTPARSLFAQTDRDLSHGCIRVEKARDLADRILADSSRKLEEALESEKEQHIPVSPPVQVQILYLTAWMDEEGALRFNPDVYEFDVSQLAALDRASGAASRPASGPSEGERPPEKPTDTAVVGLEVALLKAAPTLRPQALHAALSAWESLIFRGQAIRAVLTVIDYSLPSTSKRMWVFDLASQKLLFHELVSHGRNTGEDMAEFFSNEEGTLMTSLGAFVTGTAYTGKNGYSLRLRGMDPGINDQAEARTIVVHGAPYVSDDFAHRFGRLGRSHGCPAVRTQIARKLIDQVKEQSLLYAWHPSLDIPEPPPATASTAAYPRTRLSLRPAP